MGGEVIAVAFVLLPMMIFPATWVWMLLYGGLGLDYSYAESLPLGILSVLLLGVLLVSGSRSQRAASAPPPSDQGSTLIRL